MTPKQEQRAAIERAIDEKYAQIAVLMGDIKETTKLMSGTWVVRKRWVRDSLVAGNDKEGVCIYGGLSRFGANRGEFKLCMLDVKDAKIFKSPRDAVTYGEWLLDRVRPFHRQDDYVIEVVDLDDGEVYHTFPKKVFDSGL